MNRRTLVVTSHYNACFHTQHVNLRRNVNIRNSDAEKWEPSYRRFLLSLEHTADILKGSTEECSQVTPLPRLFVLTLPPPFIHVITSGRRFDTSPSTHVHTHTHTHTRTHTTPPNSPHCPSIWTNRPRNIWVTAPCLSYSKRLHASRNQHTNLFNGVFCRLTCIRIFSKGKEFIMEWS
jgi:hypothetical protein